MSYNADVSYLIQLRSGDYFKHRTRALVKGFILFVRQLLAKVPDHE
jgi:hypothetical protein